MVNRALFLGGYVRGCWLTSHDQGVLEWKVWGTTQSTSAQTWSMSGWTIITHTIQMYGIFYLKSTKHGWYGLYTRSSSLKNRSCESSQPFFFLKINFLNETNWNSHLEKSNKAVEKKNGQTWTVETRDFLCTAGLKAIPSKIEWDLANGPLSKLLELLDTQV